MAVSPAPRPRRAPPRQRRPRRRAAPRPRRPRRSGRTPRWAPAPNSAALSRSQTRLAYGAAVASGGAGVRTTAAATPGRNRGLHRAAQLVVALRAVGPGEDEQQGAPALVRQPPATGGGRRRPPARSRARSPPPAPRPAPRRRPPPAARRAAPSVPGSRPGPTGAASVAISSAVVSSKAASGAWPRKIARITPSASRNMVCGGPSCPPMP